MKNHSYSNLAIIKKKKNTGKIGSSMLDFKRKQNYD